MRPRPRHILHVESGRTGVRAFLLIFVLASLLILNLNFAYLKHQRGGSSYNDDDGNKGKITPPSQYLQHPASAGDDLKDFMSASIRIKPVPPRAMPTEDGDVLMLIDPERTLWTAGWNARHTKYYEEAPPAISWTSQAEEIFETEYRRLHFPSDPSDVNGWFVIKPYWWGLVSVARDYQSDILRALAQNFTLVHDGEYRFCPRHPERYLNCFWEDFNSCQESWRSDQGRRIPVVERTWQDSVKPVAQNEFPEWLWQKMRAAKSLKIQNVYTGGILSLQDEKVLNPDMYLQLKLSVLRAIMTKTIFKPRDFIRQKSEQVVEVWRRGNKSEGTNKEKRDNKGPGLLVHIRRTDKKEDLGKHWDHINFKSAAHMGLHIQEMEAALQTPFDHFLVMSDDPYMHNQALEELTPFFANGNATTSLYSDSLCHFLGSNNFNYTGHESLEAEARHELYSLLLSDAYAAVEVSDYIIGSGSCGVSQFLAWNLGGKHRFEPSMTAFWEEDIIVKECRWLLKLIDEHAHNQRKESVKSDMLRREWDERDCDSFLPSSVRSR